MSFMITVGRSSSSDSEWKLPLRPWRERRFRPREKSDAPALWKKDVLPFVKVSVKLCSSSLMRLSSSLKLPERALAGTVGPERRVDREAVEGPADDRVGAGARDARCL